MGAGIECLAVQRGRGRERMTGGVVGSGGGSSPS